jgi:hypothetical protein
VEFDLLIRRHSARLMYNVFLTPMVHGLTRYNESPPARQPQQPVCSVGFGSFGLASTTKLWTFIHPPNLFDEWSNRD